MADGFNNQWVEIFTAGRHTDSAGREHEIGIDFLDRVVAHLDLNLHEPPAVVGHPREDAPAYAWVAGLRRNGLSLEAQFADVDPDFECLVREGKFKKRSASFYTDAGTAPGKRAPYLRHVGFLGAQPPAVKGLRAIQFDEGANTITFEAITFSEGESMSEEKEKSVREQIADYFKELFGGGKGQQPAPANFTEAQINTFITNAVEAATGTLVAKNAALETEIDRLKDHTATQSSTSVHAANIAFCEHLGAARFPPAFKKIGTVDFMDTLAALPTESKVTVITFAEENGQQVEKKLELSPLMWFQNFLEGLGPFIQFGEQFGGIRATTNGAEIIDPAEMDKLREGMGTQKPDGGNK